MQAQLLLGTRQSSEEVPARNTTSICSLAPFSSRRPSSSTPDMSPHAAARLLQDLFTASHLVPYRSLPKYSLDSSHTPISFSQLSPPRDTTLSCVIIWHALFVLYCLFSLECKRHRGKNVSRVLLTPNAWNRIHGASRWDLCLLAGEECLEQPGQGL